MMVKARCLTDRQLFANFFFAEKIEYSFSDFHLASLEMPKTAYRDREPMSGWRRATMGPRGNGKTTIYIGVEVCHDIAYSLEEFIVILCEGFTLSKARLREIRYQIERNKLFQHYFGDLKGAIWQAADIETDNKVRILAGSMRGQVRGVLHPETSARPTKIIVDDGEDSQDVLNPDLRARDRRVFQQDIEGAASTDGKTHIQITGTPLHREALLPSLRDNPAWTFASFPAIEKWPERMDLWETCRQIWASVGAETEDEGERKSVSEMVALALVKDQRNDLAHAYYRAHRKKMDLGSRVLWPDGEPLFQLMTWLWANGEAAFSKEKQLIPRDPSLSTFVMEGEGEYPRRGALRHVIDGNHLVIDQRDGKTRRVHFNNLEWLAFHDPAKADPSTNRGRKSARSDYASIPTLAIEKMKAGGIVAHIVDDWTHRQPPSVQVETAFELCERWKWSMLILEEDTFGLLKDVYREVAKKRKASHLFHQLPLRALARQIANKDVRIAALEPAVSNGWITFGQTLSRVFWNQWVDHPTGDHDDGPDATEGAWKRRGFGRSGLRSVRLI